MDATTQLGLSITNGMDRLSDRDVMLALAYEVSVSAGYSTGELALAAAISNGFDRLSNADMDQIIANVFGLQ